MGAMTHKDPQPVSDLMAVIEHAENTALYIARLHRKIAHIMDLHGATDHTGRMCKECTHPFPCQTLSEFLASDPLDELAEKAEGDA